MTSFASLVVNEFSMCLKIDQVQDTSLVHSPPAVQIQLSVFVCSVICTVQYAVNGLVGQYSCIVLQRCQCIVF